MKGWLKIVTLFGCEVVGTGIAGGRIGGCFKALRGRLGAIEDGASGELRIGLSSELRLRPVDERARVGGLCVC